MSAFIRAIQGRVGSSLTKRSLTCSLPSITNARFMSTFVSKDVKVPHILVIDGYAKEGREDLVQGGASTAGDLYHQMLDRSVMMGVTSDIVYPCDDDFEDPDLSKYDGVAWTGCSLTVYSGEPRVERQIQLARDIFKTGIPSFGSCWAAQIAIMAAGGVCALSPNGREAGVARKIALTADGRSHPMYEGKPAVFDAFISHDDEITHLPPTSLLLASNQHTHVQAITVSHNKGDFWGVQYHPEYDLHEIARLTYCRIQKLIKQGMFLDEKSALQYVDDFEALHLDPTRKDIMWKYALDADVMNEDIRFCETRNWLNKKVLPYQRLRRGL